MEVITSIKIQNDIISHYFYLLKLVDSNNRQINCQTINYTNNFTNFF